MGKGTVNKAKAGQKGTGPLPGYFHPPETRTSAEAGPPDGTKMAPERGRAETEEDAAPSAMAITRQDLFDLSLDLKSHFEATIAQKLTPVMQQLTELSSAMKDVSRTADAAMDLGLALQEDSRNLQQAEHRLRICVTMLESQLRAANLKFRGFPETPDFNNNLASSLATWLASILHLEDGVAPSILNAFRVGPQSTARPNYPRDIVAQFLYPRSRNAILKRARSGGAMKFENHNIQVLLDLTPETLAKRHILKPVTEALRDSNIRFCWSPVSDVLVFRDGRQLHAEDVESGKNLLRALSIRLPPDLLEDPSTSSPSRATD